MSGREVSSLWNITCRHMRYADEEVAVTCVDKTRMRALNKQYRNEDKTTNVLTFSYDGDHDVVLCLAIAREEAIARGMQWRDYAALLLAHAFLHVAGLDHERSEADAARSREEEGNILKEAGFSAGNL